MTLLSLERHLRFHGCELARQGAKHAIWLNQETGKRTSVPRHRELPVPTARAICDQLGVPRI
ncbi:MAG: type II toxin-antitoxin system HicA family toxin [Actinobacteria bacterium]|nr:type II toxin-antitoxin system HicA family toxin [Actinomycetota bacterium]